MSVLLYYQRSANYHGVIFSVTESPRNPHGKWFRDYFHGMKNPWGFRDFHPNYIWVFTEKSRKIFLSKTFWMDKKIVRDPRTASNILKTIFFSQNIFLRKKIPERSIAFFVYVSMLWIFFRKWRSVTVPKMADFLFSAAYFPSYWHMSFEIKKAHKAIYTYNFHFQSPNCVWSSYMTQMNFCR